MGHLRVIFFSALVLLLTAVLSAAVTEEGMVSLYGKEYFKVNPHWDAGKCFACHDRTPRKGALFLRGDEYTSCTICHERGKGSEELHAVGTVPSVKIKIPPDFPLMPDRKTSCLTCHNHSVACDLKDKKKNLYFLRGGPYADMLDICFRCHDKADVKGYNPHEHQIKDGKIVDDRCIFCHSKVPDPKAKIIPGEYQLRRKLSLLCIGCHLLTPHSGAFEHLEKPKDRVLEAMKESEKKYGIIFPLDEEGRMTCATCHNPHEKGVFAEDKPAGTKYEEEKVPDEAEKKWKRMSLLRAKELQYEMQNKKNGNGVKMDTALRPEKNMRISARNGKLCMACHRDRWKK